jgi:hypothetical protein
MADRPDLTLLPGGADETALPRLQRDYPGYAIVPARDIGRGLVLIAVRKPANTDGPLVVMAEDAEEMRRILSGGYRTSLCNSCP